jgi:diguanylate cyclase (GGDEF)-like protein/PAS domain S-box-containing protein
MNRRKRLVQPTLGTKLAGVFVLFLALTAGNLMIAEYLVDPIERAPLAVAEAASLRYLPREIASSARQLVRNGAKPDALRRAVGDYEASLAGVEHADAHLLRLAGEGTHAALAALRPQWDKDRAAVERVLAAPSAPAAQGVLRTVEDYSPILSQHAATVVDGLAAAAQQNHRQVDGLLYLTVVLDLAFLVVLYFVVKRKVAEPIVEASRALRRFAGGDRRTRLPTPHARDEIGELAEAFNRTADETDHLIDELATKSAILDETSDFVGTADTDGRVISINPAGLAMLGLTAEAVVGRRLTEFHPPWAGEFIIQSCLPMTVRDGCWKGETALLTGAGREVPVSQVIVAHREGSSGEVRYFSTIMRDISEVKLYEKQLEHQATHDALTGLPNRSLLGDRLQQAMAHAERYECKVAVLFLDLDQFKFVNDSLGHEVGDRLLIAVAERLRNAVRQGDTVARQGGDEFVVVLADIERLEDAADVARKLLAAMQPPLVIDGHELFVTASIGISLFPQDGTDVPTLLRHADMAMYRAKDEGRNSFQFFASDMNRCVVERLSMEGGLRHALEREEFLLYYQPQVDLASGQIIGVEALLRWNHPDLGLVPPAKFIPLAEETGLIVGIGNWVLRKACAQNKAWQDAGLPPIAVSVNISARQFRRQEMVDAVRQTLAATGLAARHLDLELTETMIMHEPERVTALLRQLSEMGVQISVDDFGTGYSSLNYLKRFPINKVKIDQSFVREITSDPDDAAVAKTIVSIAHDMHMKVIAEGTETEGQVNALRSYGCDEIQGYFFSRPLPPDEVAALLREGRRLAAPPHLETAQRTLLLVDDEPNILSTLVRLLRSDGYRILRAESGLAALEMLANHAVGVIVSDQRMPGMSGIEFLRRAKEIHPDTVRMVLSGYTELKSVTDAINEGAVYKFLVKPWDDEQLRANVREAFQRYELRAENARLGRQLELANTQLAHAKGALELEVERKVDVLRVSQEMLELLPIGTLGIDLDGIIVTTNSEAEDILDGHAAPLLGSLAAERLPAPLADCIGRALDGGGEDQGVWRSPQGVDFRFHSRIMGSASRSKGAMLAIMPAPGNGGPSS